MRSWILVARSRCSLPSCAAQEKSMFTRYAFVLASFSFLAVSASGQTAAFSGPLPAVPASIPNSPYSAEIRATSSLKEGDGGGSFRTLP